MQRNPNYKGPGPKIGTGPSKVKLTTQIQNVQDWLDSGEVVEVDSSNVAAIGYDKEAKELIVVFINDGTYFFYPVPEYVASSMFRCNSMGKFVWAYLRDVYFFSKM